MPQQPVDMGEAILRSLVGAMARRDTVAFLAFYAAISPDVYAHLLAAVRDPGIAGALTESAFVQKPTLPRAKVASSAVRRSAASQRIVTFGPCIVTASVCHSAVVTRWFALASC